MQSFEFSRTTTQSRDNSKYVSRQSGPTVMRCTVCSDTEGNYT
jgi:hypothetical protein